MKAFSRQYRKPSLALIEHLMPYCWRCLGRVSTRILQSTTEEGNPRCKVLCRCRDLLVGQPLEDVRDNLVQGLFVVGLQLVLVFAVQLLLRQVEIQRDLLVLLELHDDEGVAGLTLPERGIQPDTEHEVGIVGLRKDHKLLDGLVLDLVVVCFAAETERRIVHVDIEATSVKLSVAG
jgi:hypothetical protein